MNIKALITTALVIGTSSLALAQPASQGGVDVRDHRWEEPAAVQYTAPAPAPAPAPIVASWGHRPMWMTLSTGDKISRNGSEHIRLSAFKPIKTLKLQATGGTTSIKDVTIKFANGQSQTVCLNQTLSGNGSATIDLSGNFRKVVSLSLTGASNRRASFEVLGV
jgi:hypothetical protein